MSTSERTSIENQDQEEVNIYLRNSQKRAHFVKIKRLSDYRSILRMVSEKLKVPSERLVLFLKGEQLIQNERISLQQKNIIHVVNLDKVQKEFINIHVKRIEGEKLITNFKVGSKSNIKEFINGTMFSAFKQNADQIFLVYTGKQLDITKTFEEELVEDQSELLCVNLDDSQYQVSEPSVILQHPVVQKIEKSNPEIELKPGRPYTQNFHKKPSTNAPGNQQDLAAPANIYKKVNIPKEVAAETFAKVQTAPLIYEETSSAPLQSEPIDEVIVPKQLYSAALPHYQTDGETILKAGRHETSRQNVSPPQDVTVEETNIEETGQANEITNPEPQEDIVRLEEEENVEKVESYETPLVDEQEGKVVVEEEVKRDLIGQGHSLIEQIKKKLHERTENEQHVAAQVEQKAQVLHEQIEQAQRQSSELEQQHQSEVEIHIDQATKTQEHVSVQDQVERSTHLQTEHVAQEYIPQQEAKNFESVQIQEDQPLETLQAGNDQTSRRIADENEFIQVVNQPHPTIQTRQQTFQTTSNAFATPYVEEDHSVAQFTLEDKVHQQTSSFVPKHDLSQEENIYQAINVQPQAEFSKNYQIQQVHQNNEKPERQSEQFAQEQPVILHSAAPMEEIHAQEIKVEEEQAEEVPKAEAANNEQLEEQKDQRRIKQFFFIREAKDIPIQVRTYRDEVIGQEQQSQQIVSPEQEPEHIEEEHVQVEPEVLHSAPKSEEDEYIQLPEQNHNVEISAHEQGHIENQIEKEEQIISIAPIVEAKHHENINAQQHIEVLHSAHGDHDRTLQIEGSIQENAEENIEKTPLVVEKCSLYGQTAPINREIVEEQAKAEETNPIHEVILHDYENKLNQSAQEEVQYTKENGCSKLEELVLSEPVHQSEPIRVQQPVESIEQPALEQKQPQHLQEKQETLAHERSQVYQNHEIEQKSQILHSAPQVIQENIQQKPEYPQKLEQQPISYKEEQQEELQPVEDVIVDEVEQAPKTLHSAPVDTDLQSFNQHTQQAKNEIFIYNPIKTQEIVQTNVEETPQIIEQLNVEEQYTPIYEQVVEEQAKVQDISHQNESKEEILIQNPVNEILEQQTHQISQFHEQFPQKDQHSNEQQPEINIHIEPLEFGLEQVQSKPQQQTKYNNAIIAEFNSADSLPSNDELVRQDRSYVRQAQYHREQYKHSIEEHPKQKSILIQIEEQKPLEEQHEPIEQSHTDVLHSAPVQSEENLLEQVQVKQISQVKITQHEEIPTLESKKEGSTPVIPPLSLESYYEKAKWALHTINHESPRSKSKIAPEPEHHQENEGQSLIQQIKQKLESKIVQRETPQKIQQEPLHEIEHQNHEKPIEQRNPVQREVPEQEQALEKDHEDEEPIQLHAQQHHDVANEFSDIDNETEVVVIQPKPQNLQKPTVIGTQEAYGSKLELGQQKEVKVESSPQFEVEEPIIHGLQGHNIEVTFDENINIEEEEPKVLHAGRREQEPIVHIQETNNGQDIEVKEQRIEEIHDKFNEDDVQVKAIPVVHLKDSVEQQPERSIQSPNYLESSLPNAQQQQHVLHSARPSPSETIQQQQQSLSLDNKAKVIQSAPQFDQQEDDDSSDEKPRSNKNYYKEQHKQELNHNISHDVPKVEQFNQIQTFHKVEQQVKEEPRVVDDNNHINQIDDYFNENVHKLQTVNHQIQSQLNENKSQESDGEFQKIEVPLQQRIQFKAGDLIYSGEMNVNETENMMNNILNDYSHLLQKEDGRQ